MDKEIADRLLKDENIIIFDGNFNKETYKKFQRDLRYLVSVGSPPIRIEINSNGGSWMCCQLMCSRLSEYTGEVTGVAVEDCHSCAFILLMHCDIRLAYYGVYMRAHKIAASSLSSRLTDDILDEYIDGRKKHKKEMKKRRNSLRKFNKKVIGLFVRETGLDFNKINKLLKKDKYYSAYKFKKLKFIHEVVDSFVDKSSKEVKK